MIDEKFDNFSHLFSDVQKKIDDLVRNRTQLNKKIQNCVNSFQMIEYEIYETLFDAREYYNKKRHYCGKKIKKLKRKAIEYEELLDFLISEEKKNQKLKLYINISHLINSINDSIKKIDNKIYNLNKKIKNQILELSDEVYIVEKIGNLERKKQKQTDLLSELEQKLHKIEYYQIHKKIELLEINLKEIYKVLYKWSNKRRNYHKRMLDLYREARKFRNFKNKMENKLRENKDVADNYYHHFLKVMNQNEKKIKKGKLHQSNAKPHWEHIITPRLESTIEKKKLYKKFMRDKLEIALEKQKAGKKLHISEYRLILKHSKK